MNPLNKLAASINITLSKGILSMLQQEQPQREHEIGYKILALGTDLRCMGVTTKSLLKLEELASLLSKVHQSDGKILIVALKPTVLALIQHKFLENSCIGFKLLVAFCLISIMMLTAPIPPYSDDIMRRVFRLIVDAFQDLDNSEGPTFGKRLEILEVMALVRSYDLMFDLDCRCSSASSALGNIILIQS